MSVQPVRRVLVTVSRSTFVIGGLGICVEQRCDAQVAAVGPSYVPFASGPLWRPDLALVAVHGPLPDVTSATVLDQAGGWSALRWQCRLAFVAREKPSNAIWRVALQRAPCEWQMHTLPALGFGKPGAPLPHALAFPMAELLVLDCLGRGRGLMLHASSVVDQGRGYVFCGRSGVGKSTTARLWAHRATVLNDDRSIVRVGDGELRVHGTPWHGDFDQVSNASAPLCAMFFPRHAQRTRARRLSVAQAWRRLLTCCWPQLWDPEGTLAFTLQLCAEIAHRVPAYDLPFRPTPEAVEEVESVVSLPRAVQ